MSQHEQEFCVAKCNRHSRTNLEISNLNVNKKICFVQQVTPYATKHYRTLTDIFKIAEHVKIIIRKKRRKFILPSLILRSYSEAKKSHFNTLNQMQPLLTVTLMVAHLIKAIITFRIIITAFTKSCH